MVILLVLGAYFEDHGSTTVIDKENRAFGRELIVLYTQESILCGISVSLAPSFSVKQGKFL